MIDAGVFKTVDILDKAADAAWKRNDAISNNIANAQTPGYKRQEVSFEGELKRALGYNRTESMSEKVKGADIGRMEARTYTDYEGFSYRLDGNNVDPETENVILVKNQVKYNALIDSITGEFTSLKAAMGK